MLKTIIFMAIALVFFWMCGFAQTSAQATSNQSVSAKSYDNDQMLKGKRKQTTKQTKTTKQTNNSSVKTSTGGSRGEQGVYEQYEGYNNYQSGGGGGGGTWMNPGIRAK